MLPLGSRVTFLGDSITYYGFNKSYGYGVSLKKKATGYLISGSGVKGDNVLDLLARFDKYVKPQNPNFVVVYIGVNDSDDISSKNKTPEVPLVTFDASLRTLVTKIRGINAEPILATLAVNGEKYDGTNPLDDRLDQYAATTLSVAASVSCQAINVRERFLAFEREYNLQNERNGVLISTADYVHPNTMGHRVLTRLFYDSLFLPS